MTITVANDGVSTLTGVTVTDPSVSDLAPVVSGGFNSGDTDHDNQLDVGETWQYTASHTVTQDDLDTDGGGDGIIENTVTVDSNGDPARFGDGIRARSSSGASLEVVKTADVSSVDAAGDVINYTINVTNTGNVTLTGLEVHDPQFDVVTPVLGDPGPRDAAAAVGRCWTATTTPAIRTRTASRIPARRSSIVAIGDENQNGIEDRGETSRCSPMSAIPTRTASKIRARHSSSTMPATPTMTARRTRARRSSSTSTTRWPGSMPTTTVSTTATSITTDNFDVGETWQFAGHAIR